MATLIVLHPHDGKYAGQLIRGLSETEAEKLLQPDPVSRIVKYARVEEKDKPEAKPAEKVEPKVEPKAEAKTEVKVEPKAEETAEAPKKTKK